jgi:phosphoesterase RecJ-like protein
MMNWDRAGRLVAQAHNAVLVTHLSPDGDAIGSLLGLAWALRQLGMRVTVAADDGVPSNLRFLPGGAEVRTSLRNVTPDLVVAVDCGDEARMGQVGAAALGKGAPLINLDHHVTNTLFGDVNLVNGNTVASAEVIFDWLPRLGVTLDERIATCLLTGIVTDTLGFRTSNVTADVLGKAQRLMDAGAPLYEITQRTVTRKSVAVLRLWAAVMPSVTLEGRLIWAVIGRETRKSAGYTTNSDGGLVSLLISVEEADIAAVFREADDGQVEIGLRAMPGFDVSETALALGGGGHALAAGATVDGPLEEAVERTLKVLRLAVQEGASLVP